AGFKKSAGARTMENNGKNNAQSNRNRRKIPASADVRLDAGRQGDGAAREPPLGEMRRFDILVMPEATKSPPMSSGRRQSHEFETRISAIADFARKGKREKKALPLFPRSRMAATIAPTKQGASPSAGPTYFRSAPADPAKARPRCAAARAPGRQD